MDTADTKIRTTTRNADPEVVSGFGDEWSRFDQSDLSPEEHFALWDAYFHIFPWDKLGCDAEGFDAGCGSGRWARLVAPRIGHLHCVDASDAALAVARRNLATTPNCVFHNASVGDLPFADGSMDFGYSLGVLHHVPDTLDGLKSCTRKLKPGAPFLVYLYYAMDNRPFWYRALWRLSNSLRRTISRMPMTPRYVTSQILAGLLYWPAARLALVCEKLGVDVASFPLAFYRHHTFYVMRTDALDRFGTRLEQRYTREQVQAMMEAAGLGNIVFSDRIPFWCAVGFRN